MLLQDHREVETKSDNIDDEIQALEDVSDEDVEYLVKGESLVIRCALNVQIKEDDLEKKRKNIFLQYAISVIGQVV